MVTENGMELQYVSEELKRDRAIVMKAVQQNGRVLKFASEALKRDRAIVMEAVKQNCMALAYASEELKGDRDVVLAAVQENGWALALAAAKLMGDISIVFEAVTQNPSALQFASEELQRDLFVVLAVMKLDKPALELEAEVLKRHETFFRQVTDERSLRQLINETLRVPNQEVMNWLASNPSPTLYSLNGTQIKFSSSSTSVGSEQDTEQAQKNYNSFLGVLKKQFNDKNLTMAEIEITPLEDGNLEDGNYQITRIPIKDAISNILANPENYFLDDSKIQKLQFYKRLAEKLEFLVASE